MSVSTDKIVCPYCGAEYEPSEIYIPQAFFGKPKAIKNDSHGISKLVGDLPCKKEKYVCDFCSNQFMVEATTSYKTTKTTKTDFRETSFTYKAK